MLRPWGLVRTRCTALRPSDLPPLRATSRAPAESGLASATLRGRDVQGLRHLREEAGLRQPQEPFDGRRAAALQPEPAACPDHARRPGDAYIRLHPLSQ